MKRLLLLALSATSACYAEPMRPRILPLKAIVALHAAWLLSGCSYNPDSDVVCSKDSREAKVARSLSRTQLETLYSDSMKLLASPDLQREYKREHPNYPGIPRQFAYLKPLDIRTSAGDFSQVSFLLKGCMDEFIQLSVDKRQIVLTYAKGSAVDIGEEVLWRASGDAGAK